MLVIMATKEGGVFNLIAAKRGKCLGWPVIDDKSTKPHRYIAHSEGMIFWREVESPEGSGEKSTTITVEDAAKQLAEKLRNEPINNELTNNKDSIKEKGFDKQIEIKLSDGLKNINYKDVSTIVIAGMGGILISDILKAKTSYID